MMICDLTSDLTSCLTIAAVQAGAPILFPNHVNCVMFDPISVASESKQQKLYAKFVECSFASHNKSVSLAVCLMVITKIEHVSSPDRSEVMDDWKAWRCRLLSASSGQP